MCASFMLDTVMYGTPARHVNLSAPPPLNLYPSAPYPDYSGYHAPPALPSDLHHTGGAWSPGFGAGARDDWPPHYGHALPVSGAEVSALVPVDPGLPSAPLEDPQDWMRRAAPPAPNPGGKTRTKDKYRVVYSDVQRLELEKEFHFSRYITIRRKAELAGALSLSERQVKIWFQNRRAKERKMNKKRVQCQQGSTSAGGAVSSTNGGLMTDSIKEEF